MVELREGGLLLLAAQQEGYTVYARMHSPLFFLFRSGTAPSATGRRLQKLAAQLTCADPQRIVRESAGVAGVGGRRKREPAVFSAEGR